MLLNTMTYSLLLLNAAVGEPLRDFDVWPRNCGRYALSLVSTFLRADAPLLDQEFALPSTDGPFSMLELETAARRAGLDTLLVIWPDPAAAFLTCPGILHVKATLEAPKPDHFVACFGSRGRAVCLADYPGLPTLVPREELLSVWSGTVLYVGRPGSPELEWLRQQVRARSPLRVWGALLTVACLVCAWQLLQHTSPGSGTRGPAATWLARVRTAAFLVVGFSSAALAWHGGLYAAQLCTGDPSAGEGGLVASPTRAVLNGARLGETAPVRFTLSNDGPRPVTIKDVERSCTCLELTDLRDQVLQPGASCELAVRFSIPEAGVETHRVYVHHDSGPPLRLTVEAVGRRHMPYLAQTGPRQVAFFDLRSTATFQHLELTTYERAHAPPWLGPMTCDLPEVAVQPSRVREQLAGPVVVRTYEYRIGWRAVPRWSEFHGKLRIEPNSGMAAPLEVGHVVGTRARQMDSVLAF